MKRKIVRCLVSWALLFLGVSAIFAYRRNCGVLDIEDTQPSITQIQVNEDGSVGIWWECYNTTVTSYRIYGLKNGKQSLIEIVACPTVHYIDKSVTNGEAVCYKIVAANSIKAKPDIALSKASELSPTIIVHKSKSVPKDITAADTKVLSVAESEGSLIVSWEPAYNIPFDGYAVYRRAFGTADWTQLEKIAPSMTQFCDSNCTPGTLYEYAVHAYRVLDENELHSICSKTESHALGGNS